MKLVNLPVLLGTIGFGGSTVLVSAATYACPSPGSPSTIISNVVESTTISVPNISNLNGLCILLRQAASDGTSRSPVARSYAGRGEWEVSPGLFAKSGSGVSITCPGATDSETCDITVPPLGEGQVYALESYVHELSEHEEAARFLEQVSLFISDLVLIKMIYITQKSTNKSHIFRDLSLFNVPLSMYLLHTNRLPLAPILMVSMPWSPRQITLHHGLTSKSTLSPNQAIVNSSASVPTQSWNMLTTWEQWVPFPVRNSAVGESTPSRHVIKLTIVKLNASSISKLTAFLEQDMCGKWTETSELLLKIRL